MQRLLLCGVFWGILESGRTLLLVDVVGFGMVLFVVVVDVVDVVDEVLLVDRKSVV